MNERQETRIQELKQELKAQQMGASSPHPYARTGWNVTLCPKYSGAGQPYPALSTLELDNPTQPYPFVLIYLQEAAERRAHRQDAVIQLQQADIATLLTMVRQQQAQIDEQLMMGRQQQAQIDVMQAQILELRRQY